jgi:hypothetical protein
MTLNLSGRRKAMKCYVSKYYDNNDPDDNDKQPDNLKVYIFGNLKYENSVINNWFQA